MLHALVRALAHASLLAVGATAVAAPVTVYDTLGASTSFVNQQGWFAADPGNGANYIAGDHFVASAGGYLHRATLPLSVQSVGGGNHTVRLAVIADAGGLPGATLDEATFDIPTTNNVWDPQLYTFDFGSDTLLQQGQGYWLLISAVAPDPEFVVDWAVNDQSALGTHAFTGALWQTPGTWFLQSDVAVGAARVQVNQVDEPAQLVLPLLTAALFVGRRARRRHRDSR